MYNFCKTFHVLPGPGGLMEQDAYYMLLLEAVMEAVTIKTERDAKDAKMKGGAR